MGDRQKEAIASNDGPIPCPRTERKLGLLLHDDAQISTHFLLGALCFDDYGRRGSVIRSQRDTNDTCYVLWRSSTYTAPCP